MTDERLDDLAATIEDTRVPDGSGIEGIRRRAHRRTARRQTVSAVAIVVVLVAAVAGAGLLRDEDAELSTAAPPDTEIEKFDQIPDGIGTWEFRAADSLVSRTGETSGFGIRRVTGADDLLIYLTDGGICVDERSCQTAADSFDGRDLEAQFVEADGGPLRSLIGPGAPFAAWNVAVVPGINGDFHAGVNRNVDVPRGPGRQQFVGGENLKAVLADVFEGDQVPHDRVVLVGSGTSGLGALFTTIEIERAVGPALEGVVVDGGALPRRPGQLPSCIVQRWGSLIGLGFPDDWDDRVAAEDASKLSGVYAYVADRFPETEFVLVTNRDDPEMRRTLRAGASACDAPVGQPTPSSFGQGIDALDAHLAGLDGWTSVVVDSAGSNPIASGDDLTQLGELDKTLRELADGATP